MFWRLVSWNGIIIISSQFYVADKNPAVQGSPFPLSVSTNFPACQRPLPANMVSSYTITSPSPSPSPSPSSLLTKPVNFICISKIPSISRSKKPSPKIFRPSCSTTGHCPAIQPSSVSQRVKRLDFEFRSLPEPIDRVKRLLQYSTMLPQFDESSRVQENRVSGCTTQVWLEVRMDGNGVMRFRVDSDSEITKGFCSCLIWLLDGAEPDEVLSVKTEDLVGMNVGLPSRGNSRVNTWQNVLISMQKRTRDLVDERGRGKFQSFEDVSSLIAVNGSIKKTQAPYGVATHKLI